MPVLEHHWQFRILNRCKICNCDVHVSSAYIQLHNLTLIHCIVNNDGPFFVPFFVLSLVISLLNSEFSPSCINVCLDLNLLSVVIFFHCWQLSFILRNFKIKSLSFRSGWIINTCWFQGLNLNSETFDVLFKLTDCLKVGRSLSFQLCKMCSLLIIF